jgi:DNA-binding NtrC family response regulator
LRQRKNSWLAEEYTKLFSVGCRAPEDERLRSTTGAFHGRHSDPDHLITGHDDIPMTVRALKAGAQDFLTKPVDEEDLLRAIRLGLARYHGSEGDQGASHDKALRASLAGALH